MFEYILREIILSGIAFLAGAGVSAGVFAFVLVIGVVPVSYTHLTLPTIA